MKRSCRQVGTKENENPLAPLGRGEGEGDFHMKKIYLDHNATTPVQPLVVKEMEKYFTGIFANPSSVHSPGQEAADALMEAREAVQGLIGASKPEEIIFTGSGTEANNLAIKGITSANEKKGRHVITSVVEHHAVLSPCKSLEKSGYRVTYLPVDKYGMVNPDDVRKAVAADTVLVSIMMVNNEIGTINPIPEIGKMLKEKGIFFHTDAVQAAGKMPVNVEALFVDALSISAHKFYGPKGVGALYLRAGTRLKPLIEGGHHEKNRRAGTENVAGIRGLAKALAIAVESMGPETKRLLKLRNMLKNGLSGSIKNIYVMGHPEKVMANTLNVCFEWIEGESIILNLDLKGISVSSGSACTSGSLEPSHVLMSMGVDSALAQGSIRFSFGTDNAEEDVKYVLEVLPEIVSRLRSMSPIAPK